MRIWSIHPKYLDTKGLVALWRENLLAKNVLEHNTRGYKNHPQLIRSKNSGSPLQAINHYLAAVYQESQSCGYHFKKEKFNADQKQITLNVTRKQIEYETQHLLMKLKIRDSEGYHRLVMKLTLSLILFL